MKEFILLGVIVMVLIATCAYSGAKAQTTELPTNIKTTTQKTTVLVFPTAIKSVDRGSADIATKTVRDVQNVLKIKAQRMNFQTTNLTVITADGKIYGFTVDYDSDPQQLLFRIHQPQKRIGNPDVSFTEGKPNAETLSYLSNIIANSVAHRHRPKMQSGNVQLTVAGIYIQGNLLFIRYRIANESPIQYTSAFSRYYIKDKVRRKRTPILEREVIPINTQRTSSDTILPNSQCEYVVAFQYFTIANHKRFQLEVYEQNGDRNLHCTLSGKLLLNAKQIIAKKE